MVAMLDFTYMNSLRYQCRITISDEQAIRCLSVGIPVVVYPDINESMPKGSGANITGLFVTSLPRPEDQLDGNEDCASDEGEKEDATKDFAETVWESMSPEQQSLIKVLSKQAYDIGFDNGLNRRL